VLDRGLSVLTELQREHVRVADRLLRSAGNQMFTIHAALLAMIQRSHDVSGGFVMMVEARNLSSAAPLVRLQLDTLVRASYILRSTKPDEVASEVVSGTEFRHMRDETGKRLLDGRLVDLAAQHHPWIRKLYEEMSGWVHLSPWHIEAAFGIEAEPGLRTITVPIDPGSIYPQVWLSLVEAAGQTTRLLLQYIESASAHMESLPRG
jgi:hypothetical protein